MKAAPFCPEETLRTARWVLENPTDSFLGENKVWEPYFESGRVLALRELVPALRDVGKRRKYLRETLEVLRTIWSRGSELEDSCGEEAKEAIADLVSVQPERNAKLSREAAEVVLGWENCELPESRFSLLMRVADCGVVDSLEKVVLDAAFVDFTSEDLAKSGGAARFIGRALRHGGTAVDVIQRLERLLRVEKHDPVKSVTVVDALRWHCTCDDEAVRDATLRLVNSLLEKPEVKRAAVVHEDGLGVASVGQGLQRKEEYRAALVAEVVEGFAGFSVDEIWEEIWCRAIAARQFFKRDIVAGSFIQAVAEKYPGVGAIMWESVLAYGNSSPFTGDSVASALRGLVNHDWGFAQGVIGSVLEVPDYEHDAARALGHLKQEQYRDTKVREWLTQLARSKNELTREAVCHAAERMNHLGDVEAADTLVKSVTIAGSAKVMDAVWKYFFHTNADNATAMDAVVVHTFDDMVQLPDLGSLTHGREIVHGLELGKKELIEVFKRRIDSDLQISPNGYWEVPVFLAESGGIPRDEKFWDVLEDLLEWFPDFEKGFTRQQGAKALFSAVVGEWDDCVLAFLEKHIKEDRMYMVKQCLGIVHAAPVSIAWKYPDSVVALLHAVAERKKSLLRLAHERLSKAALEYSKLGDPREPGADAVEQYVKCQELAAEYADVPYVQKLYEELARRAEWDAQKHMKKESSAENNDG